MPQLSNLKVRLDEVVQGLAAADQTGVAVVHQHDRRFAGHGVRVGRLARSAEKQIAGESLRLTR